MSFNSRIQQIYRFIARHFKLPPVSHRHVQRKHPGINLRRLDAPVVQLALQGLKRRARIEHVHRVAVAESLQG